MTVIKGVKIRSFLQSPDPDICAVLIYGPDRGRITERSRQLIKSVLGEKDDPFALATLDPDMIAGDPARLSDELMAMSFTGARRVVWLRGNAVPAQTAIQNALKDERNREALLIAEAGPLKPASALRKSFEKPGHTASIACYEDDGKSLGQVLDEELIASGHTITAPAREALLPLLGADRAMSRSEIEKLCLYAGQTKRIELEHVEAITGDGSATTIDQIIDSAAIGNISALERHYQKAMESGIYPGAILSASVRQITNLHNVITQNNSGKNLNSIISALRPPLHFKRRDGFLAQARIWREPELRRALGYLSKTERQCRTTSSIPEILISRTLIRIAVMAASLGRSR